MCYCEVGRIGSFCDPEGNLLSTLKNRCCIDDYATLGSNEGYLVGPAVLRTLRGTETGRAKKEKSTGKLRVT